MARHRFELVFVGAAIAHYFPKRYRRMHDSIESAKNTADEVLQRLHDKHLPTACHQAIVYGPGCGTHGMTL
jgi:hypothetical protein